MSLIDLSSQIHPVPQTQKQPPPLKKKPQNQNKESKPNKQTKTKQTPKNTTKHTKIREVGWLLVENGIQNTLL